MEKKEKETFRLLSFSFSFQKYPYPVCSTVQKIRSCPYGGYCTYVQYSTLGLEETRTYFDTLTPFKRCSTVQYAGTVREQMRFTVVMTPSSAVKLNDEIKLTVNIMVPN